MCFSSGKAESREKYLGALSEKENWDSFRCNDMICHSISIIAVIYK